VTEAKLLFSYCARFKKTKTSRRRGTCLLVTHDADWALRSVSFGPNAERNPVAVSMSIPSTGFRCDLANYSPGDQPYRSIIPEIRVPKLTPMRFHCKFPKKGRKRIFWVILSGVKIYPVGRENPHSGTPELSTEAKGFFVSRRRA